MLSHCHPKLKDRLNGCVAASVSCWGVVQGWGNLVNTAVLCALLAIFGQTGSKYNHYALDAVWRISFGLGLIPVTGMLVYRLFFLQESKVWVRAHKPASVRSARLSLWGSLNRLSQDSSVPLSGNVVHPRKSCHDMPQSC